MAGNGEMGAMTGALQGAHGASSGHMATHMTVWGVHKALVWHHADGTAFLHSVFFAVLAVSAFCAACTKSE